MEISQWAPTPQVYKICISGKWLHGLRWEQGRTHPAIAVLKELYRINCVWAAYHNMTMSAALNSGPTTTPHKGCIMYCTSSTSHKGNLATWISYSPTALGRLRTERPACKTWRRYSAKTTGWQAISWIHIHLNHARWNDSPQCTEGISKPWVVYASLIASTIHCDRLSFDTARPFVHPP